MTLLHSAPASNITKNRSGWLHAAAIDCTILNVKWEVCVHVCFGPAEAVL